MVAVGWRCCAVLVAGVVVAGCGGGGGGETTPPAAPIDLTIVVIDPTSPSGYAAGATVCFDADADLQCSSTELATNTDANGEVHLTLDATAQSTLAGGRLIARHHATVPDPASGALQSSEVVQIAAPWSAPAARIVMSPLVTWVEQLVLATMSRADARAAVAELANLNDLTVDSDFIAAGLPVSAGERQRARQRAVDVLPHQSAGAMQALRSPAAAYADALYGTGVWNVRPSTPGSAPGTYSGKVVASGVDTLDVAIGPQWLSTAWDYSAATGSYQTPQTVFLLDGLPAGPLRIGNLGWVDGPVSARRERVGPRVYQTIRGVRSQVMMRSARSLAGQPIGADLLGVSPTVPGIYPAGAQAFDTAVLVALASHLDTDVPVPRRDQFGNVFTATPTFASFDEFRNFQRAANNFWFDLGTGQGIDMAFDADALPVFRSNSFGNFIDEGRGTLEQFAFLGETVWRITPPAKLVQFIAAPLDYVEHGGVLRPAVVQRRGELTALPSRSVNRIAADALLGAVAWPVPPGAP